ncbi:hypothetical protein [Chlamydiifrater phoenicopteri]|uniref:hypothetical protein n=1 Tax=Chlamydiifrater phoenicopteri TaxID=2681469 RepID=UPI001BCF957A|nr:hypothetical protein [Chlamydiifrater phoenicopteri]
MPHYLVVVADAKEIQAFLDSTPFTPIRDNVYRIIFDSFAVDVLISGWGSELAVHTLKLWLRQSDIFYDFWINIGIAGASSSQIPLHKTYSITTVEKIIHRPKSLSNFSGLQARARMEQEKESCPWIVDPLSPSVSTRPLPIFPSAHLYTAPSPVNEGINSSFDLIDMEGYGIASIARDIGTPISLIKTTSDYTNSAAGLFIHIHLPQLSEQIKDSLNQALLFLEEQPSFFSYENV